MRILKSLRCAIVLLAMSAPLFAQQTGGGGGGGNGVGISTVAGLPSGRPAGTVYVVTDGTTGTDCVTGGGANFVFCRYSGSAWGTFISGTAAAGGTNTQVNYNNGGALAGISGWTTNGTTGLTSGATSVLDLHASGTGGLLFPGAFATGIVKVTTATGALSILAAPVGAIVGTSDTQALTNKDITGAGNTFPTFNQSTTGSAASWTTARNLAGNSVNGSADVAFANKFVVQGTADTGLSAAQFLGALGTGIVKNTTTTGVLSIAVAGDFPILNQNTTGTAVSFTGSLVGDVTGTQGATVVAKINGNSVTSGAANNQVLVCTAANTCVWKTVPDCVGSSNALNFTQSSNVFTCLSIATLSNPMTTLGDAIYGGSAGAVTRLAGPTTPNGVPEVLTSIPSAGAAVAPTWNLPGIGGRAITGTTATDIVASADCSPKRVEYVGSVAVAVTLPTATTLAVANCVFKLTNNLSTLNDVTVTPTTWTVNGAASVAIHQGQVATLYVDPNSATNWVADVTEQGLTAGTNITFTRSATGLSLAASGGGTPCTVTALSLQFNNAGAFGCVTPFTFASNTITSAAAGIFDMSAATGASAFKVPVQAGATSASDGVIDYDSTAKITHVRTNAADSDVLATTATDTTTTHAVFASATAGLYTSRSIAAGDLPAALGSSTTAHSVEAPLVCADSSGSGTAQSCTTSPSFTPAAGDCVIYTTTTANTGAGLTLNVDAAGAKSVAKWLSTTTLATNDVLANKENLTCYDGTNWELSTIGNAPGGTGTVTSFSAGTLSPLFTTSVATATSTPALTFILTNAGAGTVFGNNTGAAAAPAYTSTPVLGLAGTTVGTLGFANATSGSIVLSPTTGALGATTITLPANSQTAVVAPTSTTTTQALFATATAGAPAFRAFANTDLPAIALDKSATGLANPTADATFTYPIGSTTGFTFAGTAPASVSTATGTNATSLFNVNGVTGGADSNATGTAGVGSSPSFAAGNGGAGTGTNTAGGAGGTVTGTAGNGGASLGTGVNANGGGFTFNLGQPGTGGSGTAGKTGIFQTADSGGHAGFWFCAQGTAVTTTNSNIPANSIFHQCPTAVTAYAVTEPTAAATGLRFGVNSSGVVTENYSGSFGQIKQTAQTAAITTATLCAATANTACGQAGQYHVHWNFWGSGTACSSVTAGSVTFLLTWTDENAVTHTAVALQMAAQTGAATTAMQASFPFQTALANESASGDFTFSTNGTIVQYATGYTACTTGTGTYGLSATVVEVK